MSGERQGFGPDAIYTPSSGGAVILCGGSYEARQRVIDITYDKRVRFIDRGENPKEYEWHKAYTCLMTNVVGLMLCFDKRRDRPRLDIPNGRILNRMKAVAGVTYIPLENAEEYCNLLGRAFFATAQAKGLFTTYETWENFHQERFLDPIKNPEEFYAHIPSALQKVANQIQARVLPDGVPGDEEQILSALLKESEEANCTQHAESLRRAERVITENIRSIKDAYRKPQVGLAKDHTIRRVFNQTGEVSYIVTKPESLGMTSEQVHPYIAKAADVGCLEGECIIPMTAEIFTYGPEKIAGNVAFITNGAGFTLEALDRCVAAGVRLGFVSDLRLGFSEGKYYLAMKMAMAVNPSINTIAIDVFTTLGTSADVALAVERIARERPDMKFVVKVEGREQEQGIDILLGLKQKGVQIIFTHSGESSSPSEIQPLTLDQMVRDLRGFDGIVVDTAYERYEPFKEDKLVDMMRSALETRVRHLLSPSALSDETRREIEMLAEKGALTVESIFGREFRPTRGKEKLIGKPVVVIAGYGETSRIQARLMRKAGTEVVLLHPQIRTKVNSTELTELHELGISTFESPDRFKTELVEVYPEGIDVIGLCYEPYKPEVGNGSVYSERIEKAVDSIVRLKTEFGLSVISIVVPTEMVPTDGTKAILARCKEAGIWFIGPNSPGMSRAYPGLESHTKVAQIPAQCIMSGDIAIAGVGGTMLFETLNELKQRGRGITWAISLGGDITRGLSARDAVLVAEGDPSANYFVYIGEPGGFAAQELAEVMRAGLTAKPVLVKLIGSSLPVNSYPGHAGAIDHGQEHEKIAMKIEELTRAGAIIVYTSEQMAQVIRYIEAHPGYGRIDRTTHRFREAMGVVNSLFSIQNVTTSGLCRDITGET